MTERERLIELLKNDNCPSSFVCDANCKYINSENCLAERMADYLLENGVIVPPVEVDQSIWTAEPFTDNIPREGYITVLEYDSEGFCGFWTSFGDIPLSAEFISDDIGKTVFLTKEDAEKALAERSKHND